MAKKRRFRPGRSVKLREKTREAARPKSSFPVEPPLLVLAVVVAFLLMLRNLGHTALTYWDESFHALVAKNLLAHPFEPTLIERPFLPIDPTSWVANHIWLHKPILPLWQVAVSFATFGVNTFALRLPSLILAGGAAVLTWAIGTELIGRRPALIAAVLQAFSPAVFMLVHGYLFADTVDISLLFWTELSIYFLIRSIRRGSLPDATLSGIAQGLGFLSKTYPALIVSVVAVAALVSTRSKRDGQSFGVRQLALLIAATIATAGPWMLYTANRFPIEFRHEQLYIFQHLSTGIDSWAAPWDRVVFDYSVLLYHVFYGFVLAAAAFFLPRLARRRDPALIVLYTWGIGVLVPHLLAVSKTPSATLIGTPPFLLLLGLLLTEAFGENRRALAMCTGVAVAALLVHPSVSPPGQGFPQTRKFAAVMYQNIWVIWSAAGGAAGLVIFEIFARFRRANRFDSSLVVRPAMALTAAVVLWLFTLQARDANEVAGLNRNEPSFSDVAAFASSMPANAVFLFDETRRWGDHQLAEFRSGRTTYRYEGDQWKSMAGEIRKAGGIAFVVSPDRLNLPVAYRSARDERTVYQIP